MLSKTDFIRINIKGIVSHKFIIRIVQKNSSTFQFQTFDFQFKFK